MFGSEILDVAIGLILMFLLVSLVCSSIKEALETVLNQRSRDLERGLREMLGDLKRQHIVPALYRHPLIDGLYKGHYRPGRTRNLPSYIPSRNFALALLDLIAQGKFSEHGPDPTVSAEVHSNPEITMQRFREAVSALPLNSHLRGALKPIVAIAQDDATRLQHEVESWFDSSMDRVSGWYKRHTQIMLAGIGLSLAIAMNVDTVSILRYLNTSQTSRQVLIAHVGQFQQTHPVASGPTTTEVIDPMGWLERQGGVPLGWITSPLPGQTAEDYSHDWRRPPSGLSQWLFKISGILFTAFSVTLGAPFWFDLLNRFMVVRSTVKPDEKSPTEKGKG